MCGIFGQSTNNPKKLNQSNIKILGMFNESRGKNSCGITYDGEIYHGLLQEKLFTDFMKGRTFVAEFAPLMFGHTRSASSGLVNEFNSHPFGFGTSAKGHYKFIGVHNGTLYNHEELAKTYEIDMVATYMGAHNVMVERTKIDSEVLLEIIYKTRDFKVLSEYIGKAALVWTDIDNPAVTYLWSGKSRNSEHYLTGAEIEERPMNVWVESKNNFYFSSLPEALEAIGGIKENIIQIEYNTVYIVKNGDFEHAKKITVSRKQCFQTETYVYKGSHYNNGYVSGKVNEASDAKDDWEDHRQPSTVRDTVKNIIANNNAKVKSEINIYNDIPLLDQNEYGNRIYNYKLRYYQKGHLITGVYCYVPNYGFVKLTEDLELAEKEYERNRGLRFYNGYFSQDPTSLEGTVPFPAGKSTPIFYYFVEGAMIKTALDYKVAMGLEELRHDVIRLSYMTSHPIIGINYTYKAVTAQGIYKDGVLYTGVSNGLSFEKIYTISRGNLMSVTVKEDKNPVTTTNIMLRERERLIAQQTSAKSIEDQSKAFNPNVLTTAKQDIEALEAEIEAQELIDSKIKALIQLEEATEEEEDQHEIIVDTVLELIDTEITPCLISFQNCREELEAYPQTHESVIAAKELMHELIQLINNFTNK